MKGVLKYLAKKTSQHKDVVKSLAIVLKSFLLNDKTLKASAILTLKERARVAFGAGKKEIEIDNNLEKAKMEANDEKNRRDNYKRTGTRPDSFGDDRLRKR